MYRIVPAQQQFVKFDAASRFQPLKASAKVGILILKDSTPGEPIEYIEKYNHDAATEAGAPANPVAPVEAPAAAAEPEAPEDFDFDG